MFVVSRNRVKRSIVWLLVIAMFVCTYFAPFSEGIRTAYAEEAEEGEVTEAPQQEEESVVEEETDIEEESAEKEELFVEESEYLIQAQEEGKPILVEEECDEYTNIYQNPDGSMTAEVYDSPIRFEDDNGELVDIENELVAVTEEKKEEGYEYTNKSNEFEVFMPEDVVSETPVSIETDQYVIDFTPVVNKDIEKELKKSEDKSEYKGEVKNSIKDEKNSEKEDNKEDQGTIDSETEKAENVAPKDIEPTATQSPEPTATQSPEPTATESPEPTATESPEPTATGSPEPTATESPEPTATESPEPTTTESPEPTATEDAVSTDELVDNTIEYKSGFDESIDISYTVLSNGIKEDIILNEYTGKNTFDFVLSLEGCVAELKDDNSIEIIDGETVIGRIPAPYMFDSYDATTEEEGDINMSDEVYYSLTETKKGEYLLTVTADQAFLEDENTVYPVTIDPSTTLYTTSQVQDTYVGSKRATKNYNTSDPLYLKVGWSNTFYTSRAYIKFAIPDIAGIVTSATFSAYQNYTSASSTVAYDVHQVAQPWDVNNISYDDYTQYYSTIIDSESVYGGSCNWYNWNITNLVKGWEANPSVNYGILLKYRNDTGGTHRYRRFLSSEYGSGYGVKLTINYTNPSAPSVAASYVPSTGEAQATVSWPAISGAVRYKVYMDGVLKGETTTTSYVVGSVTAGTHSFKYYARDGYGNWSIASPSTSKTFEDHMAPNIVSDPSVTTNAGGLNSGKLDRFIVSFYSVTDRPSGSVSRYEVLMSKNSTTNFVELNLNPAGNVFTVTKDADGTDLDDNTTYRFKIRAYDSAGNYSTPTSYRTANSYDRTGPVIETGDVTISTTDWSNVDPVITWQNIYDEGPDPDVPSGLKYRFNQGAWQTLGTTSSGQATVALPDGDDEYEIEVYAYDNYGNTSNVVGFLYKKDTIPPNPENVKVLHLEDGSVVSSNESSDYIIEAIANDLDVVSWTLDYAFENTGDFHPIADGDGLLESTDQQTWNISTLNDNHYYTMRLIATDKASNTTEYRVKVLYANDAEDVDAELIMTLKEDETTIIEDGEDITVNSVEVEYELEDTEDPAPDNLGNLYANDEIKDNETSEDMGLDFDPLAYGADWLYQEGSQVFLRVETEDANDKLRYTHKIYEGHKISDNFADTDITELSSNLVLIDGKIELVDSQVNGTLQSEQQEIDGRVGYVYLTTDQTTPGNSEITYRLVYDNGESVDITANDEGNTLINVPMTKFYIEATFIPSDSFESPSLEAWHLDILYLPFDDAIAINNSFDVNARGFCALEDTRHDETIGSIELNGIEFPIQSYPSEGSVQSTKRVTPGQVYEVFLSTEEELPDGTEIRYYLHTQGGSEIEEEWQDITPDYSQFYPINQSDPENIYSPNNDSAWTKIESMGNEIVLKAVLTTTDSTVTPVLNSWSLRTRQTMVGDAHDIKLIDEPDKLSTLVNANYTTLLRWEASETEGVMYNIYRSENNPYFDISNMTPINQEPIEENYWTDFNLECDTRFYYKVTAVKTYNIDGTNRERESLPSNEVFADTVSQNELDKKLGLQDYWSYSGFKAAGGTGYVNVANGNLVFKSTDMVVAGPFYASVMSRTLNTYGKTKTPLGYGWDYSINTCLLKEYNADDEVIALVLKDGDGSFHRFEGNDDDGYSKAIGTFMELELDTDNNVYTITRKDGLSYYFDATTMRLDKFIDLNGTMLDFIYDNEEGYTENRGNLKAVENSVGEKLVFNYNVECNLPEDADYAYVNEHIDMLDTVIWTGDNDVSIVYQYTYDDDDLLETVSASVDGEEALTIQSYAYDVDLDPLVEDYNIVITDAEGRISVIELDEDGRVVNAYEPTDILSNYDQVDKFVFDYDPDNDMSGDRTTITNSYGVGLSYEYDTYGLLSKKEDVKGNSISYEHNADFQVTKVMYDNQRDENSPKKNLLSVYTYNENGNISKIKAYSRPDSSENIGNVDYYTDLGPETMFAYDETFVNKVASTTVKKDSGDTVTTSYTYDQNGNIDTTTVADGSINLYERATGPMAKTTTYEYYGINDPNGLQWQLKSVEDEYGKSTRYIYDSKGRVTDVEEYLGSSYQRTVSTYTYDDFYRTDTISEPYDKNGSTTPNVIDYDYDEFGRLEMQTNIDNTREEWEYDDSGRLVFSSISAYDESWYLENSTNYQYDLLGRLTKTEIYNDPNDEDDSVISQVDYEYDNVSLGIDGGKWDSDPDIPGVDADVIVSTDAEGTLSLQFYDIFDRLVETKIYDGATFISTAKYTYDTIGNMIEVRDSAERVSRAYYDDLNRQIKTVADPFDLPGNDNMNIETQFEYDYLGNTTQVTQVSYESEANQTATNYVTNYEYDDMSRLKKVSQANPNYGNPGEPEYLETNYYYDWLVYGEDLVKNYVVDPNGMVKETYFDYMGYKVVDFNKADMSDGDNNDGEYMKTQYEYDEIRALVEKITRTDGTYEVYDYDSIGRLEDINYYQEDATNSQTIEYTYTNMGQVETETMTDRNPDNPYTHKTQYNYDRMGQTIHVWGGTWDSVVSNPDVEASDGLDVAYEYNKAGQLVNINYDTSVTDGEHNIVYDYDNFGRINEIRFDPTVDDNNTVRSYDYDPTTGELLATKDYRDFATVTGLGNYIQTDFLYNDAGLIEQMTYTDTALGTNSNGITEQYTMAYDGRGQVISEQIDTDYSTTDAMTSVFKAYEYDSIGRLVKAGNGNDAASVWNNTTEYTYDRVGNRMSMDDGTDTFTYEYSQFNQLEEVKKNSTIHESYSYDERGNQTVKYSEYSDGSATQAEVYDYDLLNRMTKVASTEDVTDLVNNLTTINENIYNANEQRMRKTEYLYNGQGDSITRTEKYFYSGSALLYTQNSAGALRTENILDLGGSIIASKRFDDDNDPNTPYELENQHLFYHYDMRGSVMNIVRPNGTLIEGYTYDEFGNKTQTEYDSAGNEITDPSDEIFENEVTFTSSITDTSTGLQYMNARYYEPTTGRFISQDSYTGNPYDPWTQHLYSYCMNNPTNFVDPTGHSGVMEDYLYQLRMRRGTPYSPPDNDIASPEDEEEKEVPQRTIKVNSIEDYNALDFEIKAEIAREIMKTCWPDAAEEAGLYGTLTMGVVEQASCGVGETVAIGLSIDTTGIMQWQLSPGESSGSPSVSGCGFLTWTNAKKVDDLLGVALQEGGSGSIFGVTVGGEAVQFGDDGNVYAGGTLLVGYSPPLPLSGEGHADMVYTVPVSGEFSVFDTYAWDVGMAVYSFFGGK